MQMARDIDYAATAVKTAIEEKFGVKNDLQDLSVSAQEKTILVRDGERKLEGTRDNLLSAVRKSDSYEELWQAIPPA